MKIIIRTYRWHSGMAPASLSLIREKRCGNLAEGIREWMNAMLDPGVDQIRIEVQKH